MPTSVAVIRQAIYDYNHMKTDAAGTFLPHETESGLLPPLTGVAPKPCLVPAGTTLFHQGDSARGIFLLAAGAMRLARVTPDGAVVTLHLVRPGEMFAEASLFARHYHCDAIADTDSMAGLYPQAKLAAQLRGNPDALWNFTREYLRNVCKVCASATSSSRSARHRNGCSNSCVYAATTAAVFARRAR